MDLTPPPFLGFKDDCISHAQSVFEEISAWLLANPFDLGRATGVKQAFHQIATGPLRELPEPGHGRTLARFSALAEVAGHSLPLVKLYEAHTDALAILREFGSPLADQRYTWGVYAATAPGCELIASPLGDDRVAVTGIKPWCSGADAVSRALVTATSTTGEPMLIAVALDEGRCSISHDEWHAIGMTLSQTATVTFTDSPGHVIARNNEYIDRPGFWLGAIGIAACWYGAAAALTRTLHSGLQKRHDAHGLAHLGACAASLHAARAALAAAAHQVDLQSDQHHQVLALTTRSIVEDSCSSILNHVGRALGARPFCFDAEFARRAADLPVYLRQSHAERDLAALGTSLLSRSHAWTQLHHSL